MVSWQVSSWLLTFGALGAGFAWYERLRPPSKLVSLVAVLAAMAIAGRVALAPIPNVTPSTDIVLFAGYALGAAPGMVVGAIMALVSNFFFGQGPWTPWQMMAWGGVGVWGAILARASGRRMGRWPLAFACALAGLGFGAVMDLFAWITFSGTESIRGYLVIAVGSIWFNVAHAGGNFIFALALGPVVLSSLARYRRRFAVSWQTELSGARAGNVFSTGPVAAALALLIGIACFSGAAGLADSAVARKAGIASGAGTVRGAGVARNAGISRKAGVVSQSGTTAADRKATKKAATYLRRSQNSDGGFGGDRQQASGELYTGWAALGLEAAGSDPGKVNRSGKSIIRYLRDRAKSTNDVGKIERTILAVEGSGRNSRRFGGRDLAKDLKRRQRKDGSFEKQPGLTAFGIMALRAAGYAAKSRPVKRAHAWLSGKQRSDGGFSFSASSGQSDVDITGAALQALAASNRLSGSRVKRAVAYLRSTQNSDGGFGQSKGADSNAQSTAWSVQGLVAAGRRSKAALDYLRGLQRSDGSFAYSRSMVQTPVWVTAQVVPALEEKPFPLRPIRRSARALAASTGSSQGAHTSSGGKGSPRRRTSERTAGSSQNGAIPEQGYLAAAGSSGREQAGVRPRPAREPAAVAGGDKGSAVKLGAVGLVVAGFVLIGHSLSRRRRA